ncbi:translocon at the outer envelope membrane of chloroplasts [Trifolium repens]|nr:translocon at the outer envelope membrane of chloroplasts [Trifolium repens]
MRGLDREMAGNGERQSEVLGQRQRWRLELVVGVDGLSFGEGRTHMSLPASFDFDTPIHRYVFLIHPTSGFGQVTKDKKDVNVQMEMASSVKYGEGKATSLGFDMQTVGKDLAYTLRNETKFWHDDDVAYGGSLEAQLRDKNHPLGRSLSTLGISVMDWHGDLAVGCNLQSQIPIGRYTNLVARANLNNRGAGQISIRLNSSEQLQIALTMTMLLGRLLVILINCSLDNDDAVRLYSFILQPVHKWMVRHVYFPCIRFGVPKGAAALIAFLVSAVFHEISMALAGADSKELGFSCLVVEICIILTRNQLMRRNSQTTVTSSQQQWLDPSFQLNVPLVDVDKRMK